MKEGIRAYDVMHNEFAIPGLSFKLKPASNCLLGGKVAFIDLFSHCIYRG